MGSDLRATLSWGLISGAGLGFVCVLLMLPAVFGLVSGNVYGPVPLGGALLSWFLSSRTLEAVGMMVVGALAALVFVAGRWSARVVASLSAACFLAVSWEFRRGSYWQNWMANHASLQPYFIAVAIDALALAALAGVALGIAARLRRARIMAVEQALQPDKAHEM